ncbi:MAG: methyltransferase domain-containing protein [Thermoleophilia bacterium]|nr:methyltransferase domain-containing protein [Thermoleophilia bacterium]
MTAYRTFVGRALRNYLLGLWDGAEDAYRRWILDAVGRAAPESLLDVGCHDGSWTSSVAEAAGSQLRRLCGVEIVEAAAEEARARGIDVTTADLNNPLPYGDGRFDLVHANQVIEHVADLDSFVSEVRRVLAPGGRAVICTENLASWHNVAALALGYMPFSLTNISSRGAIGNPFNLAPVPADQVAHSWFHTRVLTAVGLAELLELHGLRVAERFGSGYHPLPAAIAQPVAGRDVRHAAFIGVVAVRADA